MNTTHLRTGAIALAALVVAGLAPPALHAQGPDQGLATATVFAGGLDFQPSVDYRRAVVTVSGNGVTFSQAFEPGDGLSIGMFDPEGQPLADGSYTWSLELVPDESAARELQIAAIRNGGEAPAPWEALTGTFTVAGGVIAEPDFGEAGPARPEPDSGLTSSMTLGGSPSGDAAEDTDQRVASHPGLEAKSRAAAARGQAPTALAGGFQPADRSGPERADATALALGASPELAANPDSQTTARPQGFAAPEPRSDGSNGRPVRE